MKMVLLALLYVAAVAAATPTTELPPRPSTVMECLAERPLQDIEGNSLSVNVLHLRQISVPQSCVNILCTADVLTVYDDGEFTYASVNVDERTEEGAQCLEDVARSPDAYHKSNFPVMFYRAGDVHLVFLDSSCSGGRLAKQRLLLLSALKGKTIQPLESFILCMSDLQVTRPAMHVQPHTGRSDRPPVTHLTMYSGPQARSASSGFVPQYARLELANDLVVSVLSSCVGDPAKMELINKLGATWLGEMDSCMRLICHSNLEELALGYYNYIVYDEDKMEGEACFKALQRNEIGNVVNTPLTQVRVVSAEDNSCTGTKIMVLNPAYSGTSKKLQRFLYYQAYKIHSFRCPELAETCLQQKLSQLGKASSIVPAKTEFTYQCANLLCDSRVGLTPSSFEKQSYRVTIDTDKMKPLNNVCVKSMDREKSPRGVDGEEGEDMKINVASLGVSVHFSLL